MSLSPSRCSTMYIILSFFSHSPSLYVSAFSTVINTWGWPSKAETCSEGEREKKDSIIYIVLHRDGDSDIVWIVHSLISRAKVIRQDRKDFNSEIKNTRHDLIRNKYCIMKPSRSNRPSSSTIYHGTVVFPYVIRISEKSRRIGSRFNTRTICRTEHTLRWTLMRTGPVRDAQQTSSERKISDDVTSAKQADF
jgi:hypothetical protein